MPSRRPSAWPQAARGDQQGHDAFYALLYVGLWHEAHGDAAAAQQAITQVPQKALPCGTGGVLVPCWLLASIDHSAAAAAAESFERPLPSSALRRRRRQHTPRAAATTWPRLPGCTACGAAGRREVPEAGEARSHEEELRRPPRHCCRLLLAEFNTVHCTMARPCLPLHVMLQERQPPFRSWPASPRSPHFS